MNTLYTYTTSLENPNANLLRPNYSVGFLVSKKYAGLKQKTLRFRLSAELVEKFQKKLCDFFAEFGFNVVFFERIDSFTLG